jgi:presenilin-like A22 family membrane protease
MRKPQIKNDLTHFSVGALAAMAALWIFGWPWAGIITAALLGLAVEIYQLIWKSEPWWVIDRICDWAGYILGGGTVTIIAIKGGLL